MVEEILNDDSMNKAFLFPTRDPTGDKVRYSLEHKFDEIDRSGTANEALEPWQTR